ncbi:MAG: OPT/YSL family transporter, partial [Candidatus Magasanikbacteria bacterium]|nr:OPT/YSL family transporter [Candidatus Magasanikbacteria bacterium]
MSILENSTTIKSVWDGVTLKSVISGFILAVIMCAANSYLTLKAGVIEEGPIIAALIFTGIFFALKQKVTTTEAMIAATMGSAGGSFGFVTNIFAAFQMVGITLTTGQMMLLTLSTGVFSV